MPGGAGANAKQVKASASGRRAALLRQAEREQRSIPRDGIFGVMPDFTELPIPEVDFETVGPQVGERFPDVVLPDQRGRLVDLHRDRNRRKALVVFHRSADW